MKRLVRVVAAAFVVLSTPAVATDFDVAHVRRQGIDMMWVAKNANRTMSYSEQEPT